MYSGEDEAETLNIGSGDPPPSVSTLELPLEEDVDKQRRPEPDVGVRLIEKLPCLSLSFRRILSEFKLSKYDLNRLVSILEDNLAA